MVELASKPLLLIYINLGRAKTLLYPVYLHLECPSSQFVLLRVGRNKCSRNRLKYGDNTLCLPQRTDQSASPQGLES